MKKLSYSHRSLALCLFMLLVGAACIHKPSGPVSPWERVNVNLAALGQINADVAKGMIAEQQAGVITVGQAAPILEYQETVAKDHQALENILAAGSTQSASQAAQIRALLGEIKTEGTALIHSGGLGVKNPKSQQTFTQDLQGIINLADVVLSDYEQVEAK